MQAYVNFYRLEQAACCSTYCATRSPITNVKASIARDVHYYINIDEVASSLSGKDLNSQM